MACADDHKTTKFTFIWKIKNLFFCTQSIGEYIDSPKIIVHSLNKTEWFLRLYPRGRNFSCYIPCFLRRSDSDGGPEEVVIDYCISLMAVGGSIANRREVVDHLFRRSSGFGFPDFVKREDILRNESLYVAEDTLTIVCVMWQGIRKNNLTSTICKAYTRIAVESRSFLWEITHFTSRPWNKCVVYQAEPPAKESTKFAMTMSLNPSDDFLEISIERTVVNDTPVLLRSNLAFMDSHGNRRNSKKEDHIFMPSEEIWNYPPFIKKNKLISNDNLYLPNDALTLSCEFAISTGVAYNEIESYDHDFPKSQIRRIYNTLENKPQGKSNVRNDIYQLYIKQKLCDLTLQNKSDYILVHKTVLCARSSVFCDLIENDLTIKETGVIEIPDFDSETLSRMLVFLYTDVLDNVSCQIAMKLYLAATQYKIYSLKESCSTHMIDNLSVENVCGVLDFAQHQFDDTLKAFAQRFICHNADEVFCSSHWKNFMANSIQLAGETLYEVFLRK